MLSNFIVEWLLLSTADAAGTGWFLPHPPYSESFVAWLAQPQDGGDQQHRDDDEAGHQGWYRIAENRYGNMNVPGSVALMSVAMTGQPIRSSHASYVSSGR